MDTESDEFQDFVGAVNAIRLATRVLQDADPAQAREFAELIELEAATAEKLARQLWLDDQPPRA